MRTKRWVQLLCFSLLFLLSAQPLCMAATGPTNAEVQEFKEAAYAFAEAASNVPPEIVLAAMPGAIATTEAVGAISKEDAQLLRKAFSDKWAAAGSFYYSQDGLSDEDLQATLSRPSAIVEMLFATHSNDDVMDDGFATLWNIVATTQTMRDATAKRRILLNGYSDAGPAALSSESTEIIIPQ